MCVIVWEPGKDWNSLENHIKLQGERINIMKGQEQVCGVSLLPTSRWRSLALNTDGCCRDQHVIILFLMMPDFSVQPTAQTDA